MPNNTYTTPLLCRLCQKSDDWYIDIFDPNGTPGMMVYEVIEELLQIPVAQDDGLPCTVCQECVQRLTDFSDFKVMCIETVINLRRLRTEGLEANGSAVHGAEDTDPLAMGVEANRMAGFSPSAPHGDGMVPQGANHRTGRKGSANRGSRDGRTSSGSRSEGVEGFSSESQMAPQQYFDSRLVDAAVSLRRKHLQQYGLSIENPDDISEDSFGSTTEWYQRSLKESLALTDGLWSGWSEGRQLGEEGNQCTVCHTSFGSNEGLSRHMRTFHSALTSVREAAPTGGKNPSPAPEWNAAQSGPPGTYGFPAHNNAGAQGIHGICVPNGMTTGPVHKLGWDGKGGGSTAQGAEVGAKRSMEKPFSCDSCGKKFHLKQYLKRHQQSHVGPHECDVCGIKYASKTKLEFHQKSHNPSSVCKVCGMAFRSRNALRIHGAVHSSRVRQECEVCGKRFFKLSKLVAHRAGHAEKPLGCHLCGETFAGRKSLSEHVQCHSVDAPFEVVA